MLGKFTPALLITLLALVASVATAPAAVTLDSADYVYPDSSGPNGFEPSSSKWSSSGNLTPASIANVGLGISDPDNASSLMYSHSSPPLASNPGALQALVRANSVVDTSSAWSNDAIGWRLVLDDGSKRMELTLARDPVSKGRVVRVQNAVNVQDIPFPWDNGFHNLYEVERLANGEFLVSVTNADPAAIDSVQTRTVPSSSLPSSGGGSLFGWGMGLAGGGASFWQEVHASVLGPDPAPDDGTAPLPPPQANTGSPQSGLNLRAAMKKCKKKSGKAKKRCIRRVRAKARLR